MDKRTIIAVGLIIAVIGLYNIVIIPRFAPPPAPPPATGSGTAGTEAAAPGGGALPSPPAVQEIPAEVAPPPPTSVPEQVVRVERPLFDAEFSNVGGGLRSWLLKQYLYPRGAKDEAGAPIEDEPIEFVRPGGAAIPLALTFLDPATQASFAQPLAVTETPEGFELQGTDGHGLSLTRAHRFLEDGYTVEITVRLENHGEVPRSAAWEIAFGPGIDRHLPESDRREEGAVALVGGDLDKVKAKKVGQRQDLGPVDWVALGSRYFIAAMLPEDPSLAAFVRRTTEAGETVGLRSDAASLAPRQSATYRLRVYLGPKQRDLLGAVGRGLERGVDYGWFSFLAIPFLGVLQFAHRFLHSYGLAILALTLLVKVALFPISYKMFSSMRKMQDLQPKLQAMKTKFKGDNQALQRATMELYREHKVNPMAGCLPMFVQIPVFFALYRVLYNAIELRGAGFLYIPDLSLKDPLYITPILMGATMLIQQRMTPTAADPTQAKMMMFLPVIFTAMFINFSSGLVLYFLYSNLFSIAEQKLFRKLVAGKKGAVLPVEPPPGGKKKRRSR